MNKQLGCLCAFAALFVVVYAESNKATVFFSGPINGQIIFTETDKGVQLQGTIKGLPQGKHGFHVHELGDLSNGCASTGSHFNPYNKTHGGPDAANRHVGDLGNIEANSEGVAHISIIDKHIALKGETDIIGRAVVIHKDPDDLGLGGEDDSLSTGHAGARLACGIIGRLAGTGTASSLTSNFIIAITSLSVILYVNVL